jgi:Ca2+-binding EF-hand superfamily protein
MRSFIWAVLISASAASVASAQLVDIGDPPKRDAKKDAAAAPVGNAPAQGGSPQANAMFTAIDADGDGVITKVELRKAIKALQTLDADSDGSITLAEANVGAAPGGPAGLGPEDPQIARLMANDLNGDQQLTRDEVPAALMPMLQGADRNGNQALDRQELAAAMANMRNQFGGAFNQGVNGVGPGGARGANDANDATGQFLQNDRNGDGKLSEDEMSPDMSRKLRNADRNGDGAIDAGELQEALRKMGRAARAAGAEAGANRRDQRGRAVNRNRDDN